jgi:hypothetical protein
VPKFQRILTPLSSGQKMEAAGPLKCWYLCTRLDSITFQKTAVILLLCSLSSIPIVSSTLSITDKLYKPHAPNYIFQPLAYLSGRSSAFVFKNLICVAPSEERKMVLVSSRVDKMACSVLPIVVTTLSEI